MMAHTGLYSLVDPTKHISRFGNLNYVSREINPTTGRRKVKPCCESKIRLLLSAVVTVVSFTILVTNYTYLNKPVIPIPGLIKLSGSDTLVPYNSAAIPVSGLFCESVTFNRAVRDGSIADLLWYVLVYLKPAHESLPSRAYDFSITNDDITLDAGNSWYMRYVHLHSGSNFTINSCVLEGVQSKVCVLEGQRNYRKWLSDLYNCNGHEYITLNSCAENQTNSLTTVVPQNDTYYFVHYAILNGSETSHLLMEVSISSLDYDFLGLDYNISCASSLKSSEPCTTPTLRGQAIVMAYPVAGELNNHSWSFEDTIYVSWNCAISLKTYLIICIPYLVILGCFNIYNLYVAINKEFKCWARIRSRNGVPDEPEKANFLQACCNRLPFNPIEVYKKFNNSIKTIFTKLVISFIVLVLAITFAETIIPVLRYRTDSNFVFAPGETRSFTINKFFCSSLSIDVVGSSHLSASLWITEDDPQLKVFTKETVTMSLSCEEEHVCMNDVNGRVYMHPGSTFADIIVDNTASYGTVYLGVFSREVTLPSNTKLAVTGGTADNFTISDPAGTNIFVLYSLGDYVKKAVLTFEVNRIEYSTNISSIEHCETHSYTATSCTVPVPFGVGYVNGLLQVAFDSEEHTDFEYLAVNAKCNYRIDALTLLWLPVLIFNILMFVVSFLALSRLRDKCKKIAAARAAAYRANAYASPANGTEAAVSDTAGSIVSAPVVTVETAEATSPVPAAIPPPISEEPDEVAAVSVVEPPVANPEETTVVQAVEEVYNIAEEEEEYPASETKPLIV